MRIRKQYLQSPGDQLTRLCSAALAVKDAQDSLARALDLINGLTAPVSLQDLLVKQRQTLAVWDIRFEEAVYDAALVLHSRDIARKFPLFSVRADIEQALATAQQIEAAK